MRRLLVVLAMSSFILVACEVAPAFTATPAPTARPAPTPTPRATATPVDPNVLGNLAAKLRAEGKSEDEVARIVGVEKQKTVEARSTAEAATASGTVTPNAKP